MFPELEIGQAYIVTRIEADKWTLERLPVPAPEPAPVPEPTPEPTPEPEPEPTPEPSERKAFEADPVYDPADETEDVATWYSRVNRAWDNGREAVIMDIANTEDVYSWRVPMDDLMAWALLLHDVPDPAIVETIYEVTQAVRAQLADHNGDGYLDARCTHERFSPDGAEPHAGVYMSVFSLHTIASSGLYALALRVMHDNRAHDVRYAEAADFWADYLENHYWAAYKKRARGGEKDWTDDWMWWITAKGTTRDFAVLIDSLPHAFANTMMVWYVLADVTGDKAMFAEAQRMAGELRDLVKPGGGWDHRIEGYAGKPQPCENFGYAAAWLTIGLVLRAGGYAPWTDDDFCKPIFDTWLDVYGRVDPVAKTAPDSVCPGKGNTADKWKDALQNGVAFLATVPGYEALADKARAVYNAVPNAEWIQTAAALAARAARG